MNEQQQQQQQQQQPVRRSKWDIPADVVASSATQQQHLPSPSPPPLPQYQHQHQETHDKLKHVQDAVRRIHEKIQPTPTPIVVHHHQQQQQQNSFSPSTSPSSSSSSSSLSQSFIPIAPETTTSSSSASSSSLSSSSASLPYTIGPDNTFIKEIEINNARNRYTLTKGATLTEIERESGATVTVKGRYYKDGEERDPNDERPLFLHIAAENEEQLNKAVAKIDQLMKQTSNFLTAKVFVDIENPDPGFNIPANLIGKGGINVKHITQASGGTRVQLKGRGSGYREPNESEESDEPLHLHLSSSNPQNLEKGKSLAESLLRKVRQNHDKYVEQRRQYQLERQQQREQQREQKQQQQQQQQHHQQQQQQQQQHAAYGAYSNPSMAQYYQYYGYQPNAYAPYPASSDVAATPPPPPPGISPSGISSVTPPPPPPGTAPVVSPPGVNPLAQYPSQYQQYYDYYYGSAQANAVPAMGSTPPPPPPGTTTTTTTSTPPPPPPPGTAPVQPGPPGIASTDSPSIRKRKFEDVENGTQEDHTSSTKRVKQDVSEQQQQDTEQHQQQQPMAPPSTDTSQLYGGLTEQEYYNQYYQNYYAQYYQQQAQTGQGVWQQGQLSGAPDQQYQQQHQQTDEYI